MFSQLSDVKLIRHVKYSSCNCDQWQMARSSFISEEMQSFKSIIIIFDYNQIYSGGLFLFMLLNYIQNVWCSATCAQLQQRVQQRTDEQI